MSDAYHGTPITPLRILESLGPRFYCLSYYRPDQIAVLVLLAIRLMIDNGAYSAWKKGVVLDSAYWRAFYDFVLLWLPQAAAGSWFVMPDVIDAGTQEQDALIRECPAELLPFGVPVWHMDEPIARLLRLIETHGRVCMGSTAEFATVGSRPWRGRMDEAWTAIWAAFGVIPPVHMLRGMQCQLPTFDYPFETVDSTDLARNHNRMNRLGDNSLWGITQKANRWDAMNCPTTWPPTRLSQFDLFEAA